MYRWYDDESGYLNVYIALFNLNRMEYKHMQLQCGVHVHVMHIVS